MPSLGAHLRLHRDAIRDEWARRVKERIPAATDKRGPALMDHVPLLLEAFADRLDRRAGDEVVLDLARTHAEHRFEQDYDLREVAGEYAILRAVLHEFARALPGVGDACEPVLASVQAMDRELDRVVYEAIEHYVDERDRGRELFVALLTHDLRNPLETARLALSTLDRDVDPTSRQRELVDTARSNLATMTRLLGDLTDFVRVRLGKGLPLSLAAIDAGAVVREVVAEFRVAHPDREVHLGEVGELRVSADPTRLTQAVTNLLSNAVKHGSDPVHVDARQEGVVVVVEVANHGTLPESVRRSLFDPFTSSGGVGMGLGLYIVCEILRAHGGRVHVDTGDGRTRFRLELPAA